MIRGVIYSVNSLILMYIHIYFQAAVAMINMRFSQMLLIGLLAETALATPTPEPAPACPEAAPACPDTAPACPEVAPACPEVAPACPEAAPACPPLAHLFGASTCFRVVGRVPYRYSWAQAHHKCRVVGMELASIHSQQENDFIADLTDGRWVWLALAEATIGGGWAWSDGSALDYESWGPGYPTGEASANCMLTNDADGNWMDKRCDDANGLVCRAPAKPSCAPGAVPYGLSACFWVDHRMRYDWKQAQELCEQRGMKLASIHSRQENDFIAGLLDGIWTWIALGDGTEEGRWVWSDGSPVDYVNWQSGQPNGGRRDNCAQLHGWTWYDLPCSDRSGVVCRGPSLL